MRRWQLILELLLHYTLMAVLLHLCFPLGRSGGLPLVACYFLLPWSWFAENRIVLGNVSWQFGPSSFVLGHFFLLGVGLGLDMKWAGVVKFFGPTTSLTFLYSFFNIFLFFLYSFPTSIFFKFPTAIFLNLPTIIFSKLHTQSEWKPLNMGSTHTHSPYIWVAHMRTHTHTQSSCIWAASTHTHTHNLNDSPVYWKHEIWTKEQKL